MLSFIEKVTKLVHVWMEACLMCIRYDIEKMFLKMSLCARENATSVAECLDKFENIYDDMRKHLRIELYPFSKSVSEYLLRVSYEEQKETHMIGTNSGCLKMEKHR